MATEGILTDAQEKEIVRGIVALSGLKNIKKAVLKLVLNYGISYLDNKLVEDKLSDEVKEKISAILAYIDSSDSASLADYVNKNVDIPGLDEEDEEKIISVLSEILIKYYKKLDESLSSDDTEE